MKKIAAILTVCAFYCATLSAEPRCYRDAADHFFDNDKAIMTAFSLHRITQSSWTPMIHELQRQSRRAYSIARQRARQLDPNPLDPFDAEKAQALLMDSLLIVFAEVMNSFLITNPDDIQQMLNYIQQYQPGWDACFAPPQEQ